ncbi:unnamed protein product, partial [Prunus brigantina]
MTGRRKFFIRIAVDCLRTVSDVYFFQQTQNQKSLERILYAWLNTIPALFFWMSYVFKSGTERYSNTHISKNHGAPFATSPGKRRAFTRRTGKITCNQLGRSGMQW